MRVALASLAVALVLTPAAPLAKELAVGDAVPDFLLVGDGGTEYRPGDFKGVRGYVFAWFPLAFTGG